MEFAPAAIALAMSPENLMPPSAMTGTSLSFRADTTLAIAEICGTPTPVTILVVHIEPGPMPTLMASAPASTNFEAPAPVATFPAINCSSG